VIGWLRRRMSVTGEDAGSAMVEFVMLVGPLMVPLVLLIVAIFETQRTAFAAVEAARQGGRAYVTAASPSEGAARAHYAANLAFVDQGLPPLDREDFSIDPPGVFCRGASIVVTVRGAASLPMLPRELASFKVTASHTETVDELRNLPAC